MSGSSTPTGGESLKSPGIELHSIDWVPEHERHGKVSNLGAIWFVGNINLTAMATGVTALSIGAGLIWTLIAATLGALFGTFFMASHSAQGPQLGLPQLVQSRPQFGYIGAAVTVWIFALINYIAYNTSDAILSADAFHTLTGADTSVGYLLAAGAAALIALYGYHWIHKINRLLTFPLLGLMVLLTIAALTDSQLPRGDFEPGPFHADHFMTVFVIAAGFQLGWAPYVSDYSRYLPANVGVRSTFWWTYLSSGLSAIWVFFLGAVLSATAGPSATPVEAVREAGDRLFPGFGWIAVLGLLFGLISVMAINQYGGMMSMISIRDSIKPVKPSRKVRAGAIAVMFLLVWGTAQFVGVERFNAFYGNVLIFLAYLFTPWTAINLIDYFFVRKGRYLIKEIFNPNGVYGRWGWRGNLAYLAALVAMVPFMVTTPFTGFAADALSGVDISIFVGLPVAGLLYLVLCRNLDVAAERQMAIKEGVLPNAH
ncbi:purine-cytosine permease family protein [Arthrobacter sp. NPDC056493]|uniref:purine-cytosine permease family protein n=1 Tax=Arthrobacter sp. NPDC056493 TaxID=3345839 RepID=UPI003670C6B3